MCNVIHYTVIKNRFSSLSLSLFNFNAQYKPYDYYAQTLTTLVLPGT